MAARPRIVTITRTRAAALVVLASASLVAMGLSAPAVAPRESSTHEGVRFWQERIAEVGGPAAYAELAAYVDDKRNNDPDYTESDAHFDAHPFGAALYASLGSAGLPICDDRFSYGCLHTFLAESIADRSVSVIRELNEMCMRSGGILSRNCQHGLGHGLIDYFGYDRAGLDQALATCTDIGNNGVTGGCYGGVFMEYNIRTLWFEDSFPRALPAEIIEPCDSVSDPARPPCFFRLTHWWRQTMRHDEGSKMLAMFADYCASESPRRTDLYACAAGLGYLAALLYENRMNDAFAMCVREFDEHDVQGWCGAGPGRRMKDIEMPFDVRWCDSFAEEHRRPCLVSGLGEVSDWNALDREVFGIGLDFGD